MVNALFVFSSLACTHSAHLSAHLPYLHMSKDVYVRVLLKLVYTPIDAPLSYHCLL